MQNAPIQGINVPQVQGELSVWQGMASTGSIPERLLVRGMDSMGQMAFITRGTTKFLSMLHTRFPKSKEVSTREHRVIQMDELDRVMPITVGTTGGVANTFGVSNANAAQMQPNDIVYVKGLYMNTVAGAPVYSTAFGWQGGACFAGYEPLLVLGVGNNDSNGIGHSVVTVRRAFSGQGSGDFQGGVIAAPAAPAAITTSMQILRGLPSFPEGGDAPRGFHKNPIVDNNFTQEFKYAVEQTKESEIEKVWIQKTPMELYKILKMRQSNLDAERTFLYGRKAKMMDSAGRVQYTMGGVIESIIQDTDHVISYNQPTINYPGILDLVDKIMRNGGGTEKDFYCGLTLYNEIKKAFYSSGYLRFDEESTSEFDIPIESLVGAGGKLNIIPLYTMEEMGWSNKALVLDFSVPAFVPVTHGGWDMIIDKDIQNPGQQIYKEQWIGIKGLERRYAQYQHIVYFPNI